MSEWKKVKIGEKIMKEDEINKQINDLALKSSFNSRKRFQSTFQDVG